MRTCGALSRLRPREFRFCLRSAKRHRASMIVIRNLKGMAQAARRAGVTVVIKQHGGNTGTGEACARILAEVGDEAIKICYDAGNVLDYEKKDPIPDIRACWRHVRAFAIKDHRLTPKDEDCGPGLGQIDHYKLLEPVMRTGLTIPLACENLFARLRRGQRSMGGATWRLHGVAGAWPVNFTGLAGRSAW